MKRSTLRLLATLVLAASPVATAPRAQEIEDHMLGGLVAAWNTRDADAVMRLLHPRTAFYDAHDGSNRRGTAAVGEHLARIWRQRGHRPIACAPIERFDMVSALIAACRDAAAVERGDAAPVQLWFVIMAERTDEGRRLSILQLWPRHPAR